MFLYYTHPRWAASICPSLLYKAQLAANTLPMHPSKTALATPEARHVTVLLLSYMGLAWFSCSLEAPRNVSSILSGAKTEGVPLEILPQAQCDKLTG